MNLFNLYDKVAVAGSYIMSKIYNSEYDDIDIFVSFSNDASSLDMVIDIQDNITKIVYSIDINSIRSLYDNLANLVSVEIIQKNIRGHGIQNFNVIVCNDVNETLEMFDFSCLYIFYWLKPSYVSFRYPITQCIHYCSPCYGILYSLCYVGSWSLREHPRYSNLLLELLYARTTTSCQYNIYPSFSRFISRCEKYVRKGFYFTYDIEYVIGLCILTWQTKLLEGSIVGNNIFRPEYIPEYDIAKLFKEIEDVIFIHDMTIKVKTLKSNSITNFHEHYIQ